jgi:phage terminase Nu1 subunit (DNA packaging protein)
MAQRSGKIVNKRELGEVFGVSPQAIDGWLSRGCPFLKKGGPLVGYQFDTAAVAEWRAEQRVAEAIGDKKPQDEENAELRKVSAEASLAELKLARELGQLVALDDVDRVWTSVLSVLRIQLLSIPSRIAAAARETGSTEETRQVIESALHETLNDIAANGLTDNPLDGEGSAAESGVPVAPVAAAATEADPQPVGGQQAPNQRRKRRAGSVADKQG